jgi:Tfp pilus assembly protein PilX
MLKRLSSILVLAGALAIFAIPAQASETRVHDFSLVCDGTVRTIVFDATNLGTATTRFIQGASVAVQGNSLTFLRVRVAGDETKTLVNMGAGEASSHENYTGFFSTPNNAGTITFEITASCQGSTNKGPTVLNGYAVIQFFS